MAAAPEQWSGEEMLCSVTEVVVTPAVCKLPLSTRHGKDCGEVDPKEHTGTREDRNGGGNPVVTSQFQLLLKLLRVWG